MNKPFDVRARDERGLRAVPSARVSHRGASASEKPSPREGLSVGPAPGFSPGTRWGASRSGAVVIELDALTLGASRPPPDATGRTAAPGRTRADATMLTSVMLTPESLLRDYAVVRVSAITRTHPDGGPPETSAPWRFVFQHDPTAWFAWTATQRLFAPTVADARERLVRVADAALKRGSRHPRVDTAIERDLTEITLDFAGLSGWASARCDVNHYEARRSVDAPEWRDLLLAMASVMFDALDAEGRDALRRCLDWFAPPSLPGWDTGVVHACPPHTRFLPVMLGAEGFFLRVGQPPGPSRLFRVRSSAGALVVLDGEAGRELAVIAAPATRDHVTTWSADEAVSSGAVFRDDPRMFSLEWDGGAVLYVHALATRGVYLQRA